MSPNNILVAFSFPASNLRVTHYWKQRFFNFLEFQFKLHGIQFCIPSEFNDEEQAYEL